MENVERSLEARLEGHEIFFTRRKFSILFISVMVYLVFGKQFFGNVGWKAQKKRNLLNIPIECTTYLYEVQSSNLPKIEIRDRKKETIIVGSNLKSQVDIESNDDGHRA